MLNQKQIPNIWGDVSSVLDKIIYQIFILRGIELIQLIDKRKGKYSIKEVDMDYLIEYNDLIYTLNELKVVGLKLNAVILKDGETELLYKRIIKKRD